MSKLTINGLSINPRRDHVLVCMDELEKITSGGIIIPDNVVKEVNFKGEIVIVSKYDLENDTEFQVGKRVIVSKQSGIPLHFDDDFGHKYKMFNKAEIKYVF